MDILTFVTSRRSNTEKLFRAFKKVCEEEGHTVNHIYYSNTMKPCTGCKACTKLGKCVIDDDITKALKQDFDAIVIVSPVYFFSLSSRAETFLNRLYSVKLDNKALGLILPSGSEGLEGGIDLIKSRFDRIDSYCGTATAPIFNKVTHDKDLPVTNWDIKCLKRLLCDLEERCT